MTTDTSRIITRAQRVAFMNTNKEEGTPKFERMTGFTTMTTSKEPKEYARQYVDENTERSDVVGYAPSTEFAYDRHTNTPVHDILSEIHDKERLGNDAHVEIISVDLFAEDEEKKCPAIKRTYAVVPDADGDGTDAMVYSGTFRAVYGIEEGYATSADGWKTAEYTAKGSTGQQNG